MSSFKITQGIITDAGLPGAQVLSAPDLAVLIDGDVSSTSVTVSGSIGIELDIQQRFKVSELRYYYSGVSEIHVFFSQVGDEWDEVGFDTVGPYVSVSGVLSDYLRWPSLIRITHAAVSAPVYAYEVELFGYPLSPLVGGSYSVDSTQDSTEVSPVSIRNPSGSYADVHCFLDEQALTSISVSSSPLGPFFPLRGRGFIPGSAFSIGDGLFSGTTQSGSDIVLATASGVGWYFSPVLDTVSASPLRTFVDYTTLPGITAVDWDSSDGNLATMAIRDSNVAPQLPWVPGALPATTDPLWGPLSGTLAFYPVLSDSIIGNGLCHGRYVQAAVRLMTTDIDYSPVVERLGFEEATTVSGVAPHGTSFVFILAAPGAYVRGSFGQLTTFVIAHE